MSAPTKYWVCDCSKPAKTGIVKHGINCSNCGKSSLKFMEVLGSMPKRPVDDSPIAMTVTVRESGKVEVVFSSRSEAKPTMGELAELNAAALKVAAVRTK